MFLLSCDSGGAPAMLLCTSMLAWMRIGAKMKCAYLYLCSSRDEVLMDPTAPGR